MIETERLYSEILDNKHIEDIFKMESDPIVMQFYQRPKAEKLEDALITVNRYKTIAQNQKGQGAFAFYCKETKEFIGLGLIVQLEMKDIEIGYRLPQHNWGKGYATEIAKSLLQYGFNKLNLPEIFGTTHPNNLASQSVLQKVGLTYIGDGPYYGGSKIFKISKESKVV